MDDTAAPRWIRWPRPLVWLPRPIREPRNPFLSVAVGWLTTFLPSIAIGAAVTALFPHLGLPDLGVANTTIFILVVIVSPIIETMIMAAVLELLLRFVPPAVAVAISAIGWGIAHSLAAPAWGLVIWWPFLIFSTLYVSWRQRSTLAGLSIVASTHALQNALPMLAMLAGANNLI